MDRAERRRNERAQQKAAAKKIPAVVVGDNIVAAELGHQFEARRGELPPKEPGKHRWIATAVYSLPQEMAESAHREDRIKLLDHENMVDLMIGCWDCEKLLGAEVAADSPCTAPGDAR